MDSYSLIVIVVQVLWCVECILVIIGVGFFVDFGMFIYCGFGGFYNGCMEEGLLIEVVFFGLMLWCDLVLCWKYFVEFGKVCLVV